MAAAGVIGAQEGGSQQDTAAISSAQKHVEQRLAYFRQLQARKKPEEYHLDETVTLKDGGQLLHLQTPEGSCYHLTNGQRWMFLEKSARVKTLYVCELDDKGQQKLVQNTAMLQ